MSGGVFWTFSIRYFIKNRFHGPKRSYSPQFPDDYFSSVLLHLYLSFTFQWTLASFMCTPKCQTPSSLVHQQICTVTTLGTRLTPSAHKGSHFTEKYTASSGTRDTKSFSGAQNWIQYYHQHPKCFPGQALAGFQIKIVIILLKRASLVR